MEEVDSLIQQARDLSARVKQARQDQDEKLAQSLDKQAREYVRHAERLSEIGLKLLGKKAS